MKREWLLAAVAAVALSLAGPAYAGGDVAAGEAKSKVCAACHGADGKGKNGNPSIAGQPEDELAQDLQEYKSGAKVHKAMNGLSAKLSDEDIANLAAYYASLK